MPQGACVWLRDLGGKVVEEVAVGVVDEDGAFVVGLDGNLAGVNIIRTILVNCRRRREVA